MLDKIIKKKLTFGQFPQLCFGRHHRQFVHPDWTPVLLDLQFWEAMWPKKIFRKFQIDFFFYENVFLFPIFFWPTEWKKLILWSWRILEQFIQIVKVQRNSFWKKNGIQTPTGKVRKLFIFTRGLPGAISSFLVLLIHTASRINCNLFEKKQNYSKM